MTEQETDIAPILDSGQYDFIDMGCSKGGSLLFGKKVLGGTRGIGIDIDPNKIQLTRSAGFDALQMDAIQLKSVPDSVRFVSMIDFLEHLPGYSAAKTCVEAAAIAATDFLFIRQPWFDSDGSLFANGLKLYWSDWDGHPNAMSTLELHRILSVIPKIKHFRMYCRDMIHSSADPAVHPLESPKEQHDWQSEKHPAKPITAFDFPVYRQVGCVAVLRDDPSILPAVEKGAKWTKIIYDSAQQL